MAIYFDESKDLERYISLANEHNQNCTSDTLLGYGMYGTCFAVDNEKVLKVTGDDFEVKLAIDLLDHELNSMPNIHKVSPTCEYGLWLIEMDRCSPLEQAEIDELEPILEQFHEYDEDYDSGTLESFRAFLEDSDVDSPLLMEIEELIELTSSEAGFDELDFHIDNIMRLGDKLVMIDQKKTTQSAFETKIVNTILANYKEAHNQAHEAPNLTNQVKSNMNGRKVALK